MHVMLVVQGSTVAIIIKATLNDFVTLQNEFTKQKINS